jgi:ABC-type branched-subunit amino acid transport system ATPase component/MFS family permease
MSDGTKESAGPDSPEPAGPATAAGQVPPGSDGRDGGEAGDAGNGARGAAAEARLEEAAIELHAAGGHHAAPLDAAVEEELREAVDEAGEGASSEDVETVVEAVAEETPTTKGNNFVTRWLYRATGGAALYPLAVLFGLNMVDEFDRSAFGVLTPEIRDHFGLDMGGILLVISLSLVAALILGLPIGFYADRFKRLPIAIGGAALWGVFSVMTGLAPTVWALGVSRAGSGLGRAVNDPIHNSLIADYYDIPTRPRVYAIHRYANATGQFIGPLAAGSIAYYVGWRVPFILFSVVTATFIVLALRLKEPVRGRFERKAMGASDEVADTEEEPPSWAESWRIVWQVRSLRRMYYAIPFLAIAIVGLLVLSGLYYEDVYNLDERARGLLAALLEGPAQLAGLLIGIPLATRLMAKGPGNVLRFLAQVSVGISIAWAAFALAPNIGLAVAANFAVSLGFFLLIPGIFAVMSLAVPAKVRTFGFAVMVLFIVPGLLALPVIGALADAHGIRTGLLVAAPVFLIGGWIIASGSGFVADDIAQVWKSTAARSEVALLRKRGQVKLLLARGIDVHYDNVQVLFDVNVEVDEGEIVALMGTNGAGKSTLLRAMSGLVPASAGAVVFDGRDMTYTPPDEVARRGIAQVPGGQGVFTQLSVGDNLRLAAWQERRDTAEVQAATARVLEIFPALAQRLGEPAGNLSGGQQQMLTLGMAFIAKPRLLMIDELSLGLAPAVVAQLLEMVKALRDQGVTIILVEQSVNVALTVADRAYFMEKGEIRFEGPTADLLGRPDLLRSVFLNAGQQAEPSAPTGGGAEGFGDGAGAGAGTPPGVGPGSGEAIDAVSVRATVATPADAPVVLEVRGVSRRFGGVRALDDVSFDLHSGEILGFIGPNGAGKTTLFDVISGFTPADTGSIRLLSGGDGFDLHDKPTHVRSWLGLGRSFQDGRLFPGLTVAEAIAVALEQHVEVRDPLAAALRLPAVADSEAQVAQRVDELIELLGLGAYRDKFMRELSTGTRRVVDLACVFAQDPAVVLLDEPSSGIAQREAEALGPLLKRVRDELGASLLIIEHDLPLLTSISDRMIALDLGRVVVDGSPRAVIEHPTVVASYLGTDEAAISRSDAPART